MDENQYVGLMDSWRWGLASVIDLSLNINLVQVIIYNYMFWKEKTVMVMIVFT